MGLRTPQLFQYFGQPSDINSIMVLNASSAPDPWLQSSIIDPSGQTGVSGNLYRLDSGTVIRSTILTLRVWLLFSGGVTSNNYLDPTGTVQPLSDTPPTGYPSVLGFRDPTPLKEARALTTLRWGKVAQTLVHSTSIGPRERI